MFLTSLYLKLKSVWEKWFVPQDQDIKTLSIHIMTTDVSRDSSSGTAWSNYNTYD